MKKVNLLFALLLWAVVASAQSSLTLTNCAYLWKTGAGITGSTVGIGIETPGFPSPYLLIPMDSSQSCVTTFFANGNIAPESQVTVNGFKDDKPLNGITVIDLMLMSKHILALEPLSSPYAMLAADVNKSGSITVFDIVETRKLLMGIYTEWPNSEEWRFIPEYVQFPNPNNPFQISPDSFYLSGNEFLAYDNDTLSLVGMKVGDVDGDASPTSTAYKAPTGVDSLFVILPDIELNPGNATTTISVNLSVPPQTLNGVQFRLKFKVPGLKIVGITHGKYTSAPNFGVFSDGLSVVIEGGQGLPVVAGEPMFSFIVEFSSLEPVALRDAIEVGQAKLPALAVGRNNSVNKVYRLKQQFGSTSSLFSPAANTLRATPATPNPFTDKALVQIELMETTPVLLEVFGLDGRLRWSEEQRLPAGVQELEIPAEALEPGSIGLYRVRAGSGVATGKVARLD